MKPAILLLLIFPSFGFSQSVDIKIRLNLSSFSGGNFYIANPLVKKYDTIQLGIADKQITYTTEIPGAGTFSFCMEGFSPVQFWMDARTSSLTIKDSLVRGQQVLIIADIQGSEDSKLYNMQDQLLNRPFRKPFPLNSAEKKSFYRDHTYELIDSLFTTNPNSPVLPAYISRYTSMLGPDTVAFFYNRLPDNVKMTHYGKSVQMFLDRSVLFKEGAVLEDITMVNNKGELFKLSDIKAKYIVLDFWASWCVPCRADNHFLVDAYRKLRDKGLEIVSVSLDIDKNSWLKAIEKDGLPWHHISELKGRDSEIVKQYKIGPIPYAVLLDGNLKVIATRISSNEVEKKIMSLLDNAGTQRIQ